MPYDNEISDYNKRLKLLVFLVYFGLFILLLRLIIMQIISYNYYKLRAEENMMRVVEIPAPRGLIFDRNKKIIVDNRPEFQIVAVCDQIQKLNSVVKKLSTILKLDEIEIRKKIITADKNGLDSAVIKNGLKWEEVLAVSEVIDELEGIYLETTTKRVYKLGDKGCHFTGYTGEVTEDDIKTLNNKGYKNGDIIGKIGVEKEYDLYLRGIRGERRLQVDVAGNILKNLKKIEPQRGCSLNLTIDADLQKEAFKALTDATSAIKRNNGSASPASVVVLDATNGGIMALVSYPGYDPNVFERGIKQKEYDKLIKSREYPLVNRILCSGYPPASTFKLITATAALEEKICKTTDTFFCPGNYMGFNCFVKSGHGPINFIEAIAQSCDVVFYKLGEKLGLEKLEYWAKLYGIDKPTGIDLPGEVEGFWPTRDWKIKNFGEEWNVSDTIMIAIGQGALQATPLQMACVTLAVANNGQYIKPHIIEKIIDANGNVVMEKKPETRYIPVGLDNILAIKEGMRGAVTHGTAAIISNNRFNIAGKTGTAETSKTEDNPMGRNHVWFTCFAPYDDPEIIVTVMIERAGGYGGQWAAPVAERIISKYYELKAKRLKEFFSNMIKFSSPI